MRKEIGIENQMKLGQVDISEIKIDFRCRDEIPQLLGGLQFIYGESEVREATFRILKEEVPVKDINTGRPGMHLWQKAMLWYSKSLH